VAGIALMVVMATATYNATEDAQNPSDDAIASLLFNEYAFPFELVSLALLVAMVGAVILAMKEKNQ
ncbi:MAG: NADH-quinone oxidoreductase subunit J, partial [Actinomycetota bacterium]